ncbi:MAG: hypothetical protein J7K96_07380, partial [Desulfobacteraceae bacterium]|nr:hypothetical protein [Desulfobacteraceae bacterium]
VAVFQARDNTDSDGKEKSLTHRIKIGKAHKFFGMRRSLLLRSDEECSATQNLKQALSFLRSHPKGC